MDPKESGHARPQAGTAPSGSGWPRTGSEQFPRVRSETEERLGADQRGRTIRRDRSAPRVLPPQRHNPRLINTALSALCETVRDYAIFVMNHEGIIVYWGMGAHLMKWWTPEEAEGAHLRMLYPENGSEDGSAEPHLAEAAATGEYVGEGQRVRRGGSTFWAHVVLTALREPDGTLLGFVKVTQDLTKRRATEAAVALANEAHSTRESALVVAQEATAARERAEEAQLRAEAARERAEEAAAFARDKAKNAEEQIPRLVARELAAEDARRVALGIQSDAYVRNFSDQELSGPDAKADDESAGLPSGSSGGPPNH
jgi:PAS domain S-box-containing protein